MTTTNEILEVFETFSYEQKEFVLNLLQRRHIEDRREQIAQAAIEAKLAYQANQLPLETASDLLNRLHNSLKSEE
ncbi:MAG: hypothetical protein RIT27_2359 [Pseudomonadota bacterium]|jgi:uncharacterized protein (DUF2267 family)